MCFCICNLLGSTYSPASAMRYAEMAPKNRSTTNTHVQSHPFGGSNQFARRINTWQFTAPRSSSGWVYVEMCWAPEGQRGSLLYDLEREIHPSLVWSCSCRWCGSNFVPWLVIWHIILSWKVQGGAPLLCSSVWTSVRGRPQRMVI